MFVCFFVYYEKNKKIEKKKSKIKKIYKYQTYNFPTSIVFSKFIKVYTQKKSFKSNEGFGRR